MKTETISLWGEYKENDAGTVTLTAYLPDTKKGDGAVVILPGGAYAMLAEHEGKGYAEFLAENGVTAFVVTYRHAPNKFPLPLLDARRGIQYVRYHAEKYGIDKDKIAIMGSSAGGHLAALTSTYYNAIDDNVNDEISAVDFKPNAQVLCYPVIRLLGKGVAHLGSGKNLLGDKHAEMGEELSPDLIADERAPQAFIWHTFNDGGVPVKNSLLYATKLRERFVPVEMHLFPEGNHGLGLAVGESKTLKHVSKWGKLFIEWLAYIGFITET